MSKLYNVSIYLDINTVSCPGVWLCPKGKAFLKICLFGVSDLTKEVDPFFPLVFKERFHFQKVFKNINSVYELHDKLGRSIISLELLQCPIGSAGCVKLALFNALLSDILHPYTTCFSKPLHTSGLELLFTTCKVFPGIIAPKADVSTKVMVTDTLEGGRSMRMGELGSRSVNDDEKKRQHKVCHTKNNTNCQCFQAQSESIEDLKAHRSVETDETEASQEIPPYGIKVSGRRRTERDGIDRNDNANVRTKKSPLEDQSRISRAGRGEGIASSNNRENVRKRDYNYDRRETVRPQTDGGDVGDMTSLISREVGVLSISTHNERGANRPTTLPEECVSDRGNLVSKYDERSREDHRYMNDLTGTSYGRSEDYVLGGSNVDQRTPGESKTWGNEDKYGLKKITSCERFLQAHDFGEIQRTNDQLLREKYFRCYKEGQAPSHINRERGETSRDTSTLLMNGNAHKIITQKLSNGKECHECTCLKSYKMKLKAKKIAARDQRPKRIFPHGNKYEYVSSNVGVKREMDAGAMPHRSEFKERFGDHSEQPRRIRSRSNVELYSKRFNQKSSDRSVSDLNNRRDNFGLKSRELQAEQTAPRSGYGDLSREYHEPSQLGTVRHGYPDIRSASGPETQGGRGDRIHNNDRDRPTRQYEPDVGKNRMARTMKAQPERQSRMPDSINRRDVRNAMPSGRVEPRVEPSYDHGIINPENIPVISGTEDDSSGEECECPLCKNYQETYKPKTHPCPRFRKTAGATTKIRPSRSNTGPKKVIPSRRSTVNKMQGASKKLNTSSGDRNGCGFANCDTLDHDFIGNKKDIKKFYGPI